MKVGFYTFLLVASFCLIVSCRTYKDGQTPADILNLYNEAAVNFDFEKIDKITLQSPVKEQLKDALDFMKDNHLFFEALKSKFPAVKDEEVKEYFPLLYEIYSQMAAKKSKAFKEIHYKVDYQGEDAMIFEISTKQAHSFTIVDGEWKKVFAEDEINFQRFIYLPDKETYRKYMELLAAGKTFNEFIKHWSEEKAGDENSEPKPAEVQK